MVSRNAWVPAVSEDILNLIRHLGIRDAFYWSRHLGVLGAEYLGILGVASVYCSH